ncbi:MAG: endonuclease [Lewinellaceae bacterium]|nr:endonuclease [Lewinellaceae bacterium]MCB9288156.1 endonuclease [Lewinellaceae bacterium]
MLCPRTIALTLFLVFLSGFVYGQPRENIFPNLRGERLANALRANYKPRNVLSYAQAKDILYSEIDNKGDSVYCVYSGYRLYLAPRQDPSKYLYQGGSPDGINCEHLWPRSKGAKEGNAGSDMHHLFPTRTEVNEARRNYPLGEVDDRQTERWFGPETARNSLPPEREIDTYSELGDGLFEPREDFKGDAARALFYFYTMYREEAMQADPLFFIIQRENLCHWHFQDPVDEEEYERSQRIARYQSNRPNPFVADPSLAGRMYCSGKE